MTQSDLSAIPSQPPKFTARALSSNAIREFIREQETVFRHALSGPDVGTTLEEFSARLASILLAEPRLFQSFLARGLGCSADEAGELNFLNKIVALQAIVKLTGETMNGFDLGAIVREELIDPIAGSFSGAAH